MQVENMKRNLRTAEERKRPVYLYDYYDYYYESQNPKKLKCIEESDCTMDSKFRRPLSNLKFNRPMQNNLQDNNGKNLKLKKKEERDSHLKQSSIPRSRNEANKTNSCDGSRHHVSHTDEPMKDVVTNFSETTGLRSIAETNLEQTTSKSVSGASVVCVCEMYEESIVEPVLTELSFSTPIIPITGSHNNLEQTVLEPSNGASTVGADKLYGQTLGEPVLADMIETASVIPLTIIGENLQQIILEPEGVIVAVGEFGRSTANIPNVVADEQTILEPSNGASTAGADKLYGQTLREPVLTDLIETASVIPIADDNLKQIILEPVSGGPVAAAGEFRRSISPLVNIDLMVVHNIPEPLSDESPDSCEYHRCSCHSITKLFDQRENSLLQKIETLVNVKLDQFALKLKGEREVPLIEIRPKRQEKEGVTSSGREVSLPVSRPKRQEEEEVTSPGSVINIGGISVPTPFTAPAQPQDLNSKLSEATFFSDMVKQAIPLGGTGSKATLKIFNTLFSKMLQGNYNWENKGTTIQSFPNILLMIHEAGRQINKDNYSEKSTNEMIKNSLRNARAKRN